MPPPFDTLPRDLLLPIFRHLGSHDLTVVARTCKGFLSHARQILYSNPPLTINLEYIYMRSDLRGQFFNKSQNFIDYPAGMGGRTQCMANGELSSAFYLSEQREKNFRQIQLWKTISQSVVGKYVTELRMEVDGDVVQPFDKDRAVYGLIDNLNADKIVSADIRYPDIHHIVGFQRLTILSLTIICHEVTDATLLPIGFPNLKKLEIRAGTDRYLPGRESSAMMTAQEVVKVIPVICDALCKYATIEDFAFKTVHHVLDERPGSGVSPLFLHESVVPTVSSVIHSLRIANLTGFHVTAGQDFLHHRFGLSKEPETLVDIYTLLASFANRHADQIVTATWTGGLAQPTGAAHTAMIFQPFDRLRTFKVKAAYVANIGKVREEVGRVKGVIAAQLGELERLEIDFPRTGSEHGDLIKVSGDKGRRKWLGEVMGLFLDVPLGLSRLTSLRITGQVPELSRKTGEVLVQIFPTKKVAFWLPDSLRELHLEFATHRLNIPRPAKYQDIKKAFGLKLFQAKKRLVSVSISFEYYGPSRSHTPVNFDGPESSFMCQELIFRRLPEYIDCSDAYRLFDCKKLAIWQIEPVHFHSLLRIRGHLKIHKYEDFVLPGGAYLGKDAMPYEAAEADIQALNNCEWKSSFDERKQLRAIKNTRHTDHSEDGCGQLSGCLYAMYVEGEENSMAGVNVESGEGD